MKKLLTIVMLIVAFGATAQEQKSTQLTAPVKKSSADVNQVEGYYIFTDSKPVLEYEYLGTVKFNGGLGFSSEQYTDVRNKLIKRAKKEFPRADGIIFYFATGSADRADLIKFK
jgi:hypothetical protein